MDRRTIYICIHVRMCMSTYRNMSPPDGVTYRRTIYMYVCMYVHMYVQYMVQYGQTSPKHTATWHPRACIYVYIHTYVRTYCIQERRRSTLLQGSALCTARLSRNIQQFSISLTSPRETGWCNKSLSWDFDLVFVCVSLRHKSVPWDLDECICILIFMHVFLHVCIHSSHLGAFGDWMMP